MGSFQSDVQSEATSSGDMCEHISHMAAETVRQLEALVGADLGRSYSLTQLARQARVSPRELNRAFMQVHGVSLTRWLIDIRLEAARQMLFDEHKVQPIKDIAIKTGFSSPSSLSHSYFCRFGELPSETRRKLKGKN